MNPGLEFALIVLGIGAVCIGGLAIAAVWGAGQASRAEERSRSYLRPEDVLPLTELQEKRLAERDRAVADYHVARDEYGNEHIVPVSPPEAAEGGSRTAS